MWCFTWSPALCLHGAESQPPLHPFICPCFRLTFVITGNNVNWTHSALCVFPIIGAVTQWASVHFSLHHCGFLVPSPLPQAPGWALSLLQTQTARPTFRPGQAEALYRNNRRRTAPCCAGPGQALMRLDRATAKPEGLKWCLGTFNGLWDSPLLPTLSMELMGGRLSVLKQTLTRCTCSGLD